MSSLIVRPLTHNRNLHLHLCLLHTLCNQVKVHLIKRKAQDVEDQVHLLAHSYRLLLRELHLSERLLLQAVSLQLSAPEERPASTCGQHIQALNIDHKVRGPHMEDGRNMLVMNLKVYTGLLTHTGFHIKWLPHAHRELLQTADYAACSLADMLSKQPLRAGQRNQVCLSLGGA